MTENAAFAALHESGGGTTQKCRSVRPMSAIEGNPDIHRRCAEGPKLTQRRHGPTGHDHFLKSHLQPLLC
jgi:hypothetical protein